MSGRFIDTNAYLSRWPTRRMPDDEPVLLRKSLKRLGITQAWAGSLDALLHKDLAAVNSRLAQLCDDERGNFFLPFGAVNPMLPDWEEDLRRCAEVHRMPGLRLHPNYHGYTLEHPQMRALLEQAAARRLIVQIAVTMEDERMMHPLLRVPHVNCEPLSALMEVLPEARIVLLAPFRGVPMPLLLRLAATQRVWFDISWLEGAAALSRVLAQLPAHCLLFGTHAPLFYPDAAALKMQESVLDDLDANSIGHATASSLLRWHTG